ncbi:L,D-transpeptidase [Legionella spiritensis]|uniref:Enhanced entry protein EnhA n=1 Tax=Legionella spiritensis TaxID=452 RepID=A0A0W0ZAH8_LEGSP|nr:L,D-transpeptidase [Legionella spiritensis]KTD66119.1 enhanced entry protein EnhA [Legionella spiritensis]SNV44075.1 enhanced entry protein EnhA [Legionella spiritensis]VEG90745.1 enhanced entry protein EnhA [Legionella spiritensis]
MKRIVIAIVFSISSVLSYAAPYYGTGLCAYPQYECIKVGRGQSWQTLFPDEEQRFIVQAINRTYNHLWAGKEIAVPRHLENKTLLDFSPFPLKIKPEGNKLVVVDQDKLAWGAYDTNGRLLRWGPVSSGSDKCSDSNKACRTLTGIFYFFSKENEKCKSNVFPIGRGGAKMPYCMYFHKGFAMHGSDDIPGYRASHGCVRMFTRDAMWMNHHFVELANERNNYMGTKVVIRPVLSKTSGKR